MCSITAGLVPRSSAICGRESGKKLIGRIPKAIGMEMRLVQVPCSIPASNTHTHTHTHTAAFSYSYSTDLNFYVHHTIAERVGQIRERSVGVTHRVAVCGHVCSGL